jgi:hypothetical protein
MHSIRAGFGTRQCLEFHKERQVLTFQSLTKTLARQKSGVEAFVEKWRSLTPLAAPPLMMTMVKSRFGAGATYARSKEVINDCVVL